MKISGTAVTVLMLVALAGVGGGFYYFKTTQTTRQLELQAKAKQAQQKAKEAEQKTREADARAAEAAARQKEAESKIKKAEAAKAADNLAMSKQESENLKSKLAVDEAATKKSEAARMAAEAEIEKSEQAKAAAEAAREASAKKAEAESLTLKRVEAERAKAAAELAKTEAAKAIAEAARAKSENERKTAEANAQAERDRKLRMYRRAETSRAEMLALQRAERLLALDEAGALTAADLEAAANGETPENAAPAAAEATNAVVKVDWPNAADRESKTDAAVGSLMKKLDEKAASDTHRRGRDYIQTFGGLADKAVAENRLADAQHYRRTLVDLVPDYVDIYAELIDEARQAKNREADEAKLAKDLFELVPDWQRVTVCERLLQRDEAYFSKLLAGRVDREVYVKAFRKLYEQAMRDKGERDERREKMAHICKVLATYVPDFEKLPEWK